MISSAEREMSLPPFPSTSGTKPNALHVYTIEECQNCKQRLKRDFKPGDYVIGKGDACGKCQIQRVIVLIYGEELPSGGARQSHRGVF